MDTEIRLLTARAQAAEYQLGQNAKRIERLRRQRDAVLAERDLLASRLCAIAFEAGMNWRRLGRGFDGRDFFMVLVDVALTKEEVK